MYHISLTFLILRDKHELRAVVPNQTHVNKVKVMSTFITVSSKSTPTEILVLERGQSAPRLMMGALGFKFHSSPPLKSRAV